MSHTFTMDLTVGSSGAEVTALQQFLVSKGFLTMPAGVAMGTFGPLTQSAVAAYQTSKGISPASGYFGPVTRASVNSMMSTGTGSTGNTGNTGNNNSNSGLEGGAGSVESYDLVSGLNNEEVGEDEEDVEVAGLEIEADENSDLELTAVRLVFDEGAVGTTGDFEDYATEVSVWFDGEEVARVDADGFDDDNNWTKTVSLDGGAIIRAGETGELTVALSGVSNLDSSDSSDTWTVDFRQIRFEDADGASITEDPTTGTRTFSFESFATAADTEFKITEGNDEVNDSHTIVVDSSNDTDNVPVLSFNVEIEGDADVTVDALPVGIVVTGATNVDGMISGLDLMMDGERVGSANISDCLEDADCATVGTYETFLFDDMDLTLEGGQEYEFTVEADFFGTTGTGDLDEGDTVSASTTANLIEISSSYADIEDESGEDLGASDITGTASSDASPVYISGITVDFVSANEDVREGQLAGDPDIADLEIIFDITAVGDDDVWVERDFATAGAVPAAGTDGNFWGTTTDSTTGTSTSGFTAVGTPTLSASGSTSNDDTTGSDQDFKIVSGQTRRFTFRVSIPAGGDNVNAGAQINGIKWGTADNTDTMANVYTNNMSDVRTDTVTGLIIH